MNANRTAAPLPVELSSAELLSTLRVRYLGRQPYLSVWQAMQRFTDERNAQSLDEIWLLEHDPVFTQGQAGKAEHLLFPGDIPVIQVDRGGQATYHGPGQLMVYLLLDIGRRHLGARSLVDKTETGVIELLTSLGVTAHRREGMPGVYVNDAKIASLGLRVRHGRTYHGMAFNIAMDLAPFQRINPCGYQGLNMTQLNAHAANVSVMEIAPQLLTQLAVQLSYTRLQTVDQPESCLNLTT